MRLTIDELARRTGTSSRNIRAHQAKGLLPPPELDGRTGYYGQEHLQRLEIIGDLQERGFSLAAIKQILDTWSSGGDLSSLLGFQHVISAPWTDEEPVEVTLDELTDRFPEAEDDPSLLQRAVDQGLVEARDDGTLVAPSPLLIDAGTELHRAGVPLGVILDLVDAIRTDLADVAERFVSIVTGHVVDPLVAGRSDRTLDDVVDTIRRLRPVALEVVRPFLAQELTRVSEAAVADLAGQLDASQPEAS